MIIIQLLERHPHKRVTWGAAVDGINMCIALLSVDFVKSILLSSVTSAMPIQFVIILLQRHAR